MSTPLRRLGHSGALGLLLTGILAGPLTSPAAAADRQAPTRPGPLTVSSVAQSSAVVDFGRSHDRSGEITYRIRANGHTVARTRRTSDVKVPLTCGRTYFLTAVAVDRAGNKSAASPGANLRTRACLDRTDPRRPAGLHAARVRSTKVRLVWESAKDPGQGSIPGYLITRNGVVLGGSTTPEFVARNLRPDTTYTFAVRARDRADNLSRPVAVTVTTAAPPQATGDVRAFLLATDGQSFADARKHYRRLDRVFPTFFSLTGSGDVTGTGQPTMTSWFQERGVKVLPRFHNEDPAAIEALVTDPGTRARGAAQVARVVASGGYDGVSLDLEMTMPSTGVDGLTVQQRWDRLRDGYSAFVEEVAAHVHQADGLVSVAVSPNWCSYVDPSTRQTTYCTSSASTSTRRPRAYLFDYRRLAVAADELWVMAWGLHWASSDSGAVADIRWLSAVTDYYEDLFQDTPDVTSKLTLGTHLYGMDWSERVVRTDRVAYPGSPMPTAPSCSGPARTARARTSYEGTPGAGTLVIDWVCITRYAAVAEYADVLASAPEFSEQFFDEPTGENVLRGPDAQADGAQRVLWFPDARTIQRRAALADAADWHFGFWRLGREDQDIWSLDLITRSAR